MYDMIYKRKSFHLFRDLGDEKLTEEELEMIRKAYESFTSLYPDIRTTLRITETSEKFLGRGAEYALLLYSENKENYNMNIGYLGEQLDLWLVAHDVATLWYGLGKPDIQSVDGMDYVIMILIAKNRDQSKYRKDMFKSKRKPLTDTWFGPVIDGVSNIARFAPSACNSQPWHVYHKGNCIEVYRYRKPGRIGLMSDSIAAINNRIDIGIYLYFLELCLQHEGYKWERELYADVTDGIEENLVAKYKLL